MRVFLLILPLAGEHLIFYVNHCRFEVFEVDHGSTREKFLFVKTLLKNI